MDSASRYEILDTIAAGDFATVYRARDRELGREVAVKQIHPQFLADPRQLARYWHEAQLLASLQHPNILTIYDIVRPRGWLIVELMQGSLKQAAHGAPLDLDVLRSVLVGCLHALQFLHANGVIHGDVKPGNILVGPQGRVKLGDFGLARRASNEEGSLLKGTTKYMAPELLSPQFGPIGPASDLYSLGFSAFELMCGAQFDSLLPSLSTFGRDKQFAWMMWHATADLKLPEIQRILEGVPDDLARVIQKLTTKDQARRYQSAQEVLADLRGGPQPAGRAPDAIEAAAAEMAALAARRKRRMRYIAVVAATFSALLCVLVFWPKKTPPPSPEPPQPVQGVVIHVDAPGQRVDLRVVEVKDGKEAQRAEVVKLTRHDRVFVNDKAEPLDQVQVNDYAKVERFRDESGQEIREVHAYRSEEQKGRIQSVKPDESTFVLGIEEGPGKVRELPIAVPADLVIRFNGNVEKDGRPVKLAQLQPGDRAVVRHIGQESGRAATDLSVERVVTAEGVLADDFDLKSKLLSITVGAGDKARVVKFPFADQYVITVNGQPAAKPNDLQKGDAVTFQHDTRIVRVEARRELEHAGALQHVDLDARAITLQGKDTKYVVGAQCRITLGGEPVSLDALRAGDAVRIEHRAVEGTAPGVISATAVTATRAPDPARWAILVAGQNYDDATLTPLAHSLADAKLLADVLVKRYQVPAAQVFTLADQPLVRLEQAIPEWLKKLGPEARLVVYWSGHAYKDEQGKIYLAPKDFRLRQPAANGLPIQWLVDQLEECPAREKLLLLDTCNNGQGADLAAEPSTAEMLRTLKAPPGRAPLRTVTAVASCRAGQRGLPALDSHHGLFARCLAESYAGQADTNRDNRLEPTELFGYLQRAMSASGAGPQGAQTPELFLPNDAPPRLSEDARKAIRRLAALVAQTKIDMEAASVEYKTAAKLSGKELEPRLLVSLIFIKARERDAAQRQLELLKSERPALLLPSQGLVWLRFDKRSYDAGVKELAELIGKVPGPRKSGEAYSQESQQVFYWAGQLREFAASAVPEAERPSAESLAAADTAAAAHGPLADHCYQQGRERSKKVVAKFDELIASADDEATQMKLKVDRRQLFKYAEFPFDRLTQQILAGLDE